MFRNTEIYDLKNTNNIKTRIPIKNRIKLNFQNKLVRISNFSSAFSSEVNITMDLPNAIYGIVRIFERDKSAVNNPYSESVINFPLSIKPLFLINHYILS